MKKIILSLVVFSFAVASMAQNYDPIKNLLLLGQAKKAKEDLDKQMTNAKFTSKPEAYILKATIYAALASEANVKGTPEGMALLNEAEAAFAKYREMQPDLSLAKDPVYQNGPINLYAGLFAAGYKEYEAKNWEKGYQTFSKVVGLSDMLIKEKILNVTTDTNAVILAGIMAESSKHEDDAAKYYARLADIKLGDKDYESIYRFLVNYNFRKKNMEAFDKYRALGKQLYPKSDFWDYDKVDFAVGLEDSFDKKVSAVEEQLNSDPSNYKAALLLGGIIYDTLNSEKENAVPPANAEALEAKMVTALQKANSLSPNVELPLIYLGGHYINKAKRINDKRKAHAADMKNRTKPGTQASKEDIQKRDALDLEYGKTLDLAIAPYEKAVTIFQAKPTMTLREKQQYKYIVSDLGEIYGYKKGQAKGKPADVAKFTAEEKKWNDLYLTIK